MKKPDLIKLSEFSATTLSALCDKDNAYIPAFISNTENYKVPVSNFISTEMNSWKEWSKDHGSSGLNDSVYIGANNTANGWGNTVIGTDNNVGDANVNTVIGKENDCVNSVTNTYIFGEDNVTTNDCHSNTIVGIRNDCTDNVTNTHVFGTSNIVEGGNTNTVIGEENTISGFSVSNDVFGKKNVLNGSYNLTVLGNENKATNNAVYSLIAGDNNEITDTDSRGHYVIGYNNKVSGGYVFGVSNSAAHGGMAFGQYNDVMDGSYAVGDYKSAYGGSLAMGPATAGVKSDNGSVAIGWSYIYGKPTEANNGAISIGRSSSANGGALALGTSVFARNGSTTIGFNAYAEESSVALGNDGISAIRGSYAIGKAGAYADYGSYIFGESSTATEGGMAIGKFGVNANGSSIAIGFNGMGASGQSMSIGYNGTYAWGNNSYALGMKGVTAGHESLAMGFSNVCSTSAGMAIGAQNVNADNNTFAIGYRNIGASGAPSFAIGSQGVYAFDDGFAIGVNSVSAANDSFAIGRESVSARNQSISIGKNGNFAENYGVAIGVNNSAFNHSIMLGTNSAPSFASYGSVGIHAGDMNCPFSADNRSIAIRSTYNNGVVSTNNGGISIGRSEGYTYVNNDSIAIGKVDNVIWQSDGTTAVNILSADNISIAIGKAGYRPILVNNMSTFIGNATNASAYATNMSHIVGIAAGRIGFDGNYSNGILSADTRSLVFGGTLNKSSIVEHDSISIGFDNHGYYGSVMIGDENSGFNHYSGTAYTNQWTNAYILGDYNSVENYRGVIMDSEYGKTIRGRDGIARTMSFIIGNDNRVTGYNAFSFGSQNMNGMLSYAWNTDSNSYSYDENDDGFTFTFGLLNYAARNYDMAIGYSSIASGGENIAIGGPIQSMSAYGWDRPGAPTLASGYKNISIRSRLDGIENIGIDSWNITRNNGDISNFTKNRFDNSFNISFYPAVLGSQNNMGVHRNYMSFCNDVNLNSIHITNNVLYNVENATFVASTDITDNYMFNIGGGGSSATTMVAQDVSCNVFYHTSAVGSYKDMSHNIFVDSFIDSKYGKNDCSVFDSIIYRSWTKLDTPFIYTGGTVAGFAWEDGINIRNSVLLGTVTEGSVEDTFSFGALNNSWGNNPLNYDEPPLLRHVSNSVNFGDNYIFNSIDARVIGMQNSAYNAGSTTVIGRTNYIDPKFGHGNDRVTVNNSEVIHDLSIIGTSNAVIENTDLQFLNDQTRGNSIFGSNNVINISADMEDNTVIGSTNRMCKVPQGIQDAVWNSSPFNFIVQYEYQSLVPTKDEYQRPGESWTTYAASGIDYAYIYAGYQSYSSDRNTIIGTHSVITPCVDDSLVLGNNNAAYNSSPDGTIRYSNVVAIGSYNVGVDGSNQFVAGFNNVASGHHSTAIGEELRSNEFQTVMGKYNIPLAGTVRTTSAWDYENNSAYAVENSGALFVIGNGRTRVYEKDKKWYNEAGVEIPYYDVCSPAYIERSNAMIVSANGVVSAANFATSAYANIENTLNDLNTTTYTNAQNIASILQTFGELSALLINKPTTGNYTIGCSAGNLVWVNMQQ